MPESVLERLRRRKLVQWAVAYLATAWLAAQVLDLLGRQFSLPDPVLRSASVALALGLLPVLVLAWYHGEKGAQRVSGIELLMLAGILVVAGAALLWVGARPPKGDNPSRLGAGDVGAVDPNSIAVLPFLNMSADPQQEYFSEGMTEELLNALAQSPELRVAARTSSFSFKGREVPVDSIARALRVAHVLEGSVRRSGDYVRITAQLIDVRSGYHLWSESYDRKLEDILAVQREISLAIARVLRVQLVERSAGTGGVAKVDPGAYDAYLRGLYLASQAQFASALPYLEQAVASEPRFARAWAELSDVYNQLGRRDDSRRAATRAMDGDSTSAEPNAALAYVEFFYDRNWPAADKHLQRALELRPTFVHAMQQRAYAYAVMGRGDEAVREIERAASLDPLSYRITVDRGIIYWDARRLDLAQQHFQAMLAADSGNSTARNMLGFVALSQGHTRDAARWFAAAGDTVYLAIALGDSAWAFRLLAALEGRESGDKGTLMARAYAVLHRPDAAFRWLDYGLARRERLITLAAVDTLYAPLWSDPRMRLFLDRLGPPWAGRSLPLSSRP